MAERKVVVGFHNGNGTVHCGGLRTGMTDDFFRSGNETKFENGSWYSSSENYDTVGDFIKAYQGDKQVSAVFLLTQALDFIPLLRDGKLPAKKNSLFETIDMLCDVTGA